jgi:hypothetical protein
MPDRRWITILSMSGKFPEWQSFISHFDPKFGMVTTDENNAMYFQSIEDAKAIGGRIQESIKYVEFVRKGEDFVMIELK